MVALLQPTIAIPSLILVLLLFGYLGVPLWLWSLLAAVALLVFNAPLWAWAIFGVLALILNVPQTRLWLVTSVIFKSIKALKLLPTISDTERAAIEAGTVWVDGEFFSGKPDFQRINQEPYPQLAPEIQAFIDGPVEQVCRLATDWEIHSRKDLPPELWVHSPDGQNSHGKDSAKRLGNRYVSSSRCDAKILDQMRSHRTG